MSGKKKILIVEDSPSMLAMLVNIVSRGGYIVFEADSGEAAIESVRNDHPDLVLLDWMLPDMNGDDVLRKIKQIDSTLPVIICSAVSEVEQAVDSMKYGAFDFINKPFNNEQLLEKMDEALADTRLEMVVGKQRRRFERRGGRDRRGAKDKKEYRKRKSSDRRITVFNEIRRQKKYVIILSVAVLLSAALGIIFLISKMGSGDKRNGIFYEFPFKRKVRYTVSFNVSEKEIYLYSTDETPPRVKRYRSPGSEPSGAFYDGRYVWSCDKFAGRIYKHMVDNELTVISSYASAGSSPVGIFGDGKNVYTIDADTGLIYKHKLDNDLSVLHTYKPDIAPYRMSGVSFDGEYAWISLEGETKIYKYRLKK